MPSYKPDGSIELDTTNHIGAGGVGPHGISGSTRTEYNSDWFRDLEEVQGLQADRGYEHYEGSFRYGWEAAGQHRGRQWEDVESDLEQDWRSRHTDRDWNDHRSAVRHAFERAMHVFEGTRDPDKR